MAAAAETPAQRGIQRRMKVGAMLWPAYTEYGNQGGPVRWRDTLAMARTAERAGWDSFWLADHLIFRIGPSDLGQWEAFTFLAALAAATSRIQLGPLVAAVPFRNPALLAKMADSLDEISDGRFILALGAGWHKPEFDAFGYPFDHLASRFEEALQILAPLLRDGRADFTGRYYRAQNAVLRPRGPTKAGPPLWIGASGPRMLALTARYADAYNTVWHTDPQAVAAWVDIFACRPCGARRSAWRLSMISPGRVSSQLPPVSAARSTITEPARIRRTISAVTRMGALRPGMAAVVITTSEAATRSPISSRWRLRKSSLCSRA